MDATCLRTTDGHLVLVGTDTGHTMQAILGGTLELGVTHLCLNDGGYITPVILPPGSALEEADHQHAGADEDSTPTSTPTSTPSSTWDGARDGAPLPRLRIGDHVIALGDPVTGSGGHVEVRNPDAALGLLAGQVVAVLHELEPDPPRHDNSP